MLIHGMSGLERPREGWGWGGWSGTCLSPGSDKTPLHITVGGDRDTHLGSSAALRKQSEPIFGWNFFNHWEAPLGLYQGGKSGMKDI